MSKIKIFSLGGLNENGKNMYIVNVDEKHIFVFDSGLKYGVSKMLGVDYIVPNIDYLIQNKKKIRGIFLTHGHDSNMGGISDVLAALPDVAIYATKFTMEIVKTNLTEAGITKANLKEIRPHSKIEWKDNLTIFPISVTHSIPDAVAYVLYTKDGAIVYTGDFVFDSTMTGPYKTDIGKLAYVGKQGVLCLMAESFYAEKKGHTSPNNRVSDFIGEVINKNEDRIIATILPAHIYRVQEIFDEVMKTHRKVVIMGKGLQELIKKSMEMKYLAIDPERIGDLSNLNDKGIIVLISDEKEKPFANLERIIRGFDKYIKLKETDTIFITEPSYDGIEKRLAIIMDDIARINVNVVCLSSKKHLLHHASQEDLMLMINLMNPKYYFPVKGEYRHQYMNAEVAEQLGIPKENILLKQNGDVVEFVNGQLVDSKEKIPIDEILVDGKNQGDIGELVLKDREMLGENGIVIISATLDRDTKQILAGPSVLTRGFIFVKENQEMIDETRSRSLEIIEKNINVETKKVDYTKIKNEVRDSLGKYFYHETECKPMIITVIQEV
ncbi:MAG: ribonuclease J [bacterium]|nr:ribonuclease J [bacterium]